MSCLVSYFEPARQVMLAMHLPFDIRALYQNPLGIAPLHIVQKGTKQPFA